MDANKRIAIVGAGELGQQIAYCGKRNGYNIVAFFDDFMSERVVLDIPVIGKVNDIDHLKSCFDSLVIGIGYLHLDIRKSLFEELSLKNDFATIIDKTAYIDPSATIGKGSVIFPNVVLDKKVIVGDNVFVNISATIAHDSYIGNHSFLSPRVAIAGFTTIGQSSFLGINSTIIDNLNLPDNIRLGAGSVVVNCLEGEGLYCGVPAKKKK